MQAQIALLLSGPEQESITAEFADPCLGPDSEAWLGLGEASGVLIPPEAAPEHYLVVTARTPIQWQAPRRFDQVLFFSEEGLEP